MGLRKFLLTVLVIVGGFTVPVIATMPAGAVDLFHNTPDSQGICDSETVTKLPANEQPTVCQKNTTENPIFGPNGVIAKGLSIFAIVIGIMAVIVIIISGLRMVLSGGDPNTTNASRNAIIYALVGLVIAAIAQAIVTFLLSKL